MAVKNRGTEFQTLFRHSCESLGIDCIRLYDTLQGFRDVANPCDFIISKSLDESVLLVECKSTHSPSFSLDFRQLPLLRDLSYFRSFLLIWFVERKEIWALSIEEVLNLIKRGYKSFNPDKHSDFAGKLIEAQFKRVKPFIIYVNQLWTEKEEE